MKFISSNTIKHYSHVSGYLQLILNMHITLPYKKREWTYTDNKLFQSFCRKIEQRESSKGRDSFSLKVKQYCELSQIMLNAENEDQILQLESILCSPDLDLELDLRSNEQNKEKDKEKRQQKIGEGKRIMGIISYSWDYLIRLVKGRRLLSKQESPQTIQLFNQDNITMEQSRIHEILKELRQKKFKWDIYRKDVIEYVQEQDKEMEEEIVFIKLLQNILKAQMAEIKIVREQGQSQKKGYNSPKMVAQRKADSQRLDLSKLIKIRQYYEHKASNGAEQPRANDPIALYEKKRKYNMAIIKYAMPIQSPLKR